MKIRAIVCVVLLAAFSVLLTSCDFLVAEPPNLSLDEDEQELDPGDPGSWGSNEGIMTDGTVPGQRRHPRPDTERSDEGFRDALKRTESIYSGSGSGEKGRVLHTVPVDDNLFDGSACGLNPAPELPCDESGQTDDSPCD